MVVKPRYKQTEIGVIPEDWDVPYLSELFVFKNGLNKAKKYFGYGTPIVNYMDVYNYRGVLAHNLMGRVSLTKQELKTFDVQKGDVFFTRTSETAQEVGMTSVMLDAPTDTVFSGFILRARPKDDSLNNAFKKYCFSTPSVRNQIVSKSTETTRALTNGRHLGAVAIARPTLPEQRAIADVLGDVDEFMWGLERLIAKKTKLKQAAMQQLLTGQIRLPGFRDEWEKVKSVDIGYFRGGSCFPNRFQGATEGEYPFFKVSDMNNVGNETFMKNANNYISERLRRQLGATAFPAKSIVFAKVGAAVFLERKRILSRDSCLDNNMAAFVLDSNRAHYLFVYYVLLNTKLGSLVSAAALPSLSGSVLSSIKLPLPSLHEQISIAEVLSDMDTELVLLSHRFDKARALKQAMMQELLTGKIRLIPTGATHA